MESFLQRLDKLGNCKDILRQSCKRNGLNTSLAGQMSISKLKLLNQKFKKAYSILQSKIKTCWIENQLRTFNWILIALSALENALITEFSQKHWIILQNIFEYKTRNFLKFETRRFLQQKKAKNKNWSEQQNSLLLKIVLDMQKSDQGKTNRQFQVSEQRMSIEGISSQKPNQHDNTGKDKIHWNEVARRLFEESKEQYFRSSKHCRQRWYNHIDPSKERGKWKESQDQTLLDLVNKHGKKWSQIALILHRTQHNVKNRYHSLGKGKKDIKLKKSNKNISIEQNLVKEQIKQENEKEPLITISDLTQKMQKPKQSFQVAQQVDCMEQLQNLHQIVRTEELTLNTKNQHYLFSPFPSCSPNLPPFFGSNSPSPFPFSLYTYGSFVSQQQKFTQAINNSNQSLTNRSNVFYDKQ